MFSVIESDLFMDKTASNKKCQKPYWWDQNTVDLFSQSSRDFRTSLKEAETARCNISHEMVLEKTWCYIWSNNWHSRSDFLDSVIELSPLESEQNKKKKFIYVTFSSHWHIYSSDWILNSSIIILKDALYYSIRNATGNFILPEISFVYPDVCLF